VTCTSNSENLLFHLAWLIGSEGNDLSKAFEI
jgi:hypothetical protein